MKTRKLTANLTQITRLGFVNAYLVAEEDGLTLIDTTLGGRGADALIGAARAAGGEIRRIALTHGHGDHAGNVDALRARLGPSVEVTVGDLDARILAGEKVSEKKPPGHWATMRTVPDVRLHGGERVGSLEVVPTPGHSPGHVAFRDERDGSVIAGDVFTSYGGLAVSNHFNPRFPLAFGATADRVEDLRSAITVQALDPTLLVVGHGPAIPVPAKAIERAVNRSRKALGVANGAA